MPLSLPTGLSSGSWDHGPRALRRQGILRPQMQDCYHLPSAMCDCTSSPALSEVVQATAQPPQGVAHVKPDDDHPQNFQEKWPGSLTEVPLRAEGGVGRREEGRPGAGEGTALEGPGGLE